MLRLSRGERHQALCRQAVILVLDKERQSSLATICPGDTDSDVDISVF